MRPICALSTALTLIVFSQNVYADHLRDLQTQAVKTKKADWGYWGTDPNAYWNWRNHTNRLIPVYSFGMSLESVRGAASPYRSPEKLKEIYGRVPEATLNPEAEYFDQTDIYRLQQLAVKQGKKRIILMIFDGLDWQTTRAAAIVRSGKVSYESGRGSGLAFQDYRGTQTDFGWMATAPHSEGETVDVNLQKVTKPGKKLGGYDFRLGGTHPWSTALDREYPKGTSQDRPHPYVDSSASATAMTAGIKTFNGAVNVDSDGKHVEPIARQLQRDGFAVGVVSSVPISHATPASAYANNVSRSDLQDLTRDMLGLPSIANPTPLPGLDVVIAAGFGEDLKTDEKQGENFAPGNRYLTSADLDAATDGKDGYRVAMRTPGQSGVVILRKVADDAAKKKRRMLGMFGYKNGHLPYATADGKFDPTIGTPADEKATETAAEVYTEKDIHENPTLADMATGALDVLAARSDRFWLMIEPGDVDWGSHKNNLDAAIGAVFSGDDAFQAVCSWVESHDGWSETALILTADHGHYLVLKKPERLIAPANAD